jgi:hypothetical protein
VCAHSIASERVRARWHCSSYAKELECKMRTCSFISRFGRVHDTRVRCRRRVACLWRANRVHAIRHAGRPIKLNYACYVTSLRDESFSV